MYRNNNTRQGCIVLKVYRIPKEIKLDTKDLNEHIIVNSNSLHKMIIKVNLVDNRLTTLLSNISSKLFMAISEENEQLNIKCSTSKLKINCGIVCSRSELDKVLRVSPNFIFLSKSNNFTDDVYIISNVVWNIN